MEKWREIPGYDGKYEVSTYGNIRCVNYRKTGKSQIMKMTLSRHGYHMITLRYQGKNVNRSVHRLVALTWIPNPNNLPEIDHINSIPSDNRIENLRTGSIPYSKHPLTEDKRLKISIRMSKPVIQMNGGGKYINEFKSITDAALQTKIHPGSINKCCRGKIKTAGGYKWEYKN